MRHAFAPFIALALAAAGAACAETLVRAFPGAEGFGAATPGGRGGALHFVTTLDDYIPGEEDPIPGSFRAAASAKGPRYILFRTSGTIDLKADLWIREPFVTIAGQTAPGGGIAFRDYQVVLATHDVILRHLRFRSGDRTKKEQMAVGIFGGNNSIIDHCSMSWAIDEVMSSFGSVHNLTVQWSIIAEGLSHSFHPKGEHSKGSILGGDGGITIHHSIYAHNAARNARVNNIVLDFRNNIVYNWGYRGGYTSGGPAHVNYINNYFQAGPSTRNTVRTLVFEPADDAPRLFFDGNVLASGPEQTADNRLLIRPPRGVDADAFRAVVSVAGPFDVPPVTTDPAGVARDRVLAKAGAILPRRDQADARLIEEIRTGAGRIIDSPDEVGGWPALEAADPPADRDHDGMPDEWEAAHRLDPEYPDDYLADPDGDGYPNIEEYLNGTDPNAPEPEVALDAETFRAIQRAAKDRCAEAASAFAARRDAENRQRDADRQAMLDAMDIRIEPRDGAIQRVQLGAAAHFDLVPIPAGSFLMGTPPEEGGAPNERPQQPVTISRDFYLGATAITNAQFVAIMGPTERRTREGEENHPAHEVTWFEAVEFCRLIGEKTGRTFRLPTEAEWEYACRAGTSTAFYTGDTITSDQANFDAQAATRFNPAGAYHGKPVAVAQYPPNPWGLYDMHGNQAEYCLDNVGRKYTTEPATDPQGPPGDGAKVLRGGQAKSKAEFIRSAARYGYAPGVGYGFRVVLESDTNPTPLN
ncbi:MAG: SUMF1/EgtB/PvdO family nonheme iron enzyme [Candidatus Hydrogenedentes bacterium]|nr:SUMF1/EgtB/PvdO family nonheme iron enzyme [Candidatus Hydrogenedentota bacterium]